LGDDWAATAQSIPATAQYVALGHIHRPQRVEAAGPHTEYAGSPMQLDFGEVADEKSFVVIEVSAGKPPRVDRVPYQGGARLGQWAGTITELEREAEALKRFSYLKVKITVDAPIPDLNRRVRRVLPNVIVVDAVLPASAVERPETDSVTGPAAAAAPVDQFRAFYHREHQRDATTKTLDLFSELYASSSHE
jgi:exonuclease SbcD